MKVKQTALAAASVLMAASVTMAGAPAMAAAKKTPVIGVTLMTLTNPYFSTMAAAFQKWGKANGMKVVVQGANMDQSTMLQQVDGFIEQHVDAVVMAPPDATAAVTAVLSLNKAKIPVFTVDTNVDVKTLKSQNGKLAEFVSSNNYQAGLIAGQEMATYLHGKGNIGWIDFPTAESVQERDKGFTAVISRYPGIHVVSQLNGQGSTPGGLTAASEALAAHPDIQAFFDINAPSGLGAEDAIKAAHKVGKVAVIGLTGSQAAVREVMNNSVFKFGAMQEPGVEAKIEVQNIKKYLAGKTIPAQVLTPIIKITKENAKQYVNIAYH